MNELIFIFVFLLPIAWYFGFRNGKNREKERSSGNKAGFSRTYFTGLNYLLNEESDKAIDTFVSMLEVDSETVETHLALGSLFRKRGEVDRAIRIHQNLIARPSLSSSNRKSALLQLGYDYMSAGLLDRAENIFKELITVPNHKAASLSQLLIIYQQTKDWEKAIGVADKIEKKDNSTRAEISHFYCELADEALASKAYREALGFLKKAFQVDSNNVRATLISARIHFSKKRYKHAVKCYKDLIRQDLAFLPEAMDSLIDCFAALNDQKGLIYFLQDAIQKGAGISAILAYSDILQTTNGDREAADFIASQMNQHPSVKGLLRLIDLHIKHAPDSGKQSLSMLRNVVTKLIKNKPVYHCHHCGFDSKTLFWQCPSCKHWGVVKPITGIEGE
jgi:lipopolysaccharide biosynthesis regulator YciM